MMITVETYKKLSPKGRASGRLYYNYLVAGVENEAEAKKKALRTHNRRVEQGTVPAPPRGTVGAGRNWGNPAPEYVIL